MKCPFALPFALVAMFLATSAFAGNVISCRVPIKNFLRAEKLQHCLAELPAAHVGNTVVIQNEYGFEVARGTVVAMHGSIAVIETPRISEPISQEDNAFIEVAAPANAQ